MHDNTLVYGGFKYTPGIILSLAGNSRAWRRGSVAPPALGNLLGALAYRPLRTGLTSAAAPALDWGRGGGL
jgi:hypothetical protein